MSQAGSRSEVYLGAWTNWTHGAVRGATVTLNRRDGALLTAFLAIFVAFAGSRLWRIISFVLHTTHSRDSPQDAIYHQRQAVLRNSDGAGSASWNLLSIVFGWRETDHLVYLRLLPLVAVSFLLALAIALAGVFSSQISDSAGREVLLTGSSCAIINSTKSLDVEDYATVLQPYRAQLLSDNVGRAQVCYRADATPENCPKFIQTSLDYTKATNGSCPFEDEICKSNSSNLILDTGFLDSQKHFGVNTPSNSRVSYRTVTHCAPLKLDGYAQISNSTPGVIDYYYGQFGSSNFSFDRPNVTYQYFKNVTADHTRYVAGFSTAQYSLSSFFGYAQDIVPFGSTFHPIPDLMRDDADTAIFFLSANNVAFTNATDDPWYSVHHQVATNLTDALGRANRTRISYRADDPVSVLGCSLQTQWCNPTLPAERACGPLMTAGFVPDSVIELWPNGTQRDFFNDFSSTIGATVLDIADLVSKLGASSLSSRQTFAGGTQSAIPENQWELDVEHWQNVVLAGLQRAFVELATGTSFPGIEKYLDTPSPGSGQSLCKSQKIKSSDFTSFGVLGLSLATSIGGLIIIVSYLLESLTRLMQKYRNHHGYALLEWSMNETMQLQSLAHEEAGEGVWTRHHGIFQSSIPVTRQGDLLQPFHEKPKMSRSSTLIPWETNEMQDKDGGGAVGKALNRANTMEREQGEPLFTHSSGTRVFRVP
ncbi:hypothetical protein EJ08DRAFT_661956 [Tothia fuscella]|uniref:Uncharacterized protein n=1 Tax=Tothia fuscella TaxID=1048955 RepID=A0A9P4NPZ5_9PEZI|nr:hypothetical protein EJ08DRAFT_661956 [Tothia fuscella]